MLIFQRSSNLTLKNVSLFAGPGAATIWWKNSGQIIVDGFQVKIKPGSNRLVSTAADALHMADNTAMVLIQNSFIEGMGDDAINIYNKMVKVQSIEGTTFTASDYKRLNLSQTLQIVVPDAKKTRGEAKLNYCRAANSSGISTMGLDQTIPIAVGDGIFVEEFASPGAMVFNNTFSSFRGLLRIHSPGAIFFNNTFLDSANSKILVDSDSVGWGEGPSLLFDPAR